MLTRVWLIKDVDITLLRFLRHGKLNFRHHTIIYVFIHTYNIQKSSHLFGLLLVSETHFSILWVYWKTEKSCLISLSSASGLLSYFSITGSGNKNSWRATWKQWWHFLIGCFSLTLAWYIDTIANPIWLLLTLLF